MRHLLPKALLTLLATLAFCGSASADSRTFSNGLPISPSDAANGKPGIDSAGQYPSQIQVGGMAGTITDVKVNLKHVNTGFPGDLDVLLVSPAGQKLVLMSDVGNVHTVGSVDIGFSDDAANGLPSTAGLGSGFYKPTNLVGVDGTDVFPFPAPPGPYDATNLSTFDGAEPNGKWKLYVTDDAGGDRSQITQGWELTVDTTGGKIFRDSTAIAGTDRVSPGTPPGIATPYPAPLDVTGATRKVDRVTVTLHDIAIAGAAGTDLLLVGPTGDNVLLMSDVGGGNEIIGGDLTFDDAAATSLLFSQSLELGVHKPSDDDTIGPGEPQGLDVFPSPAPSGPYGTALSSFRGTNPNGTWKLFMVDDSHGKTDAVNGGWSLNFTFSDQPVDPPATPAPAPQPQPVPQPLPLPAKVQLSGLTLKPKVFTRASGTHISYKLSGKASVKLTVLRRGKVRTSLTRAGKAGANKLRFKPSKLSPGAYGLKIKPIGGGAAESIGFRVKA